MADELIPVVVYAVVVMTFGVVGNSVVCYICGCRMRQSVLNNFVLALAVLDLISSVLCVPLEITDLTKKYKMTNTVQCVIQRFFRIDLSVCSVFILVAIATERYKRICRPLSRHINLRQCRIAIVGAVTVATLLSWPTLFIYGERTIHAGVNRTAYGTECAVNDGMHESVYPSIYVSLLFVLFFLSTIVLCVLYANIALRIWRGQKLHTDTRTKSASLPDCRRLNARGAGVVITTAATEHNNFFEELTRSLQLRGKKKDGGVSLVVMPTSSFRRRKKAAYSRKRTTFIMFLMTVTSVISYLPYVIVSILRVAIPQQMMYYNEISGGAAVVTQLCLKSFLISSAVNPFIYGFCNQKFKLECAKLLSGVKCSLPQAEETESSETPPGT